MPSRLHPNVFSAITCALLIARAAGAQSAVEVGPLVSFYAPVGSYHHEASYFRVGTPDSPRDNSGHAWGGQVRIWTSPRLGLQLQGATSSVDHDTVFTPGGPFGSSTRVLTLTAQALYNVLPASTTGKLWLSAGGGIIRHSGTAYTPYGSPTNGAGVLGLGAAIPLGRGLGISAGVSSLLYPFDLSDNQGVYQRGFQVDMLTHAGLTLSFP